jgi:hypothetical protein
MPEKAEMPQQNTRQTGQPHPIAGQRLAAFAAGAVVLLLVVTSIGLSWSNQLSPGGSPSATAQAQASLPPAKATFFAQYDATQAAMERHVPAATKGAYTPPPDVPTPTFTSGITYFDGQSKFPDFETNDSCCGQVNGTWEFVYVGSDTTNSAAGVGAIRVYTFSNTTGEYLVGIFDATDGSTGLDITGINRDVLRLKSDKTASLGFDLTTNIFTS